MSDAAGVRPGAAADGGTGDRTARLAKEKRHPIQVVASRTGLTKDVLRAWERRYAVVEPGRTDSGRRLYSDLDVERLQLLRLATSAGRSVKRVSRLTNDELDALVQEDEAASRAQLEEGSRRAATPAEDATEGSAADLVAEALAATEALDTEGLREALDRAVVVLRPGVLVEEMIAPLLRGIGELWWRKRLDPRHEHLASAVVRATLDRVLASLAGGSGDRPILITGTLSGQRHELGAMLAAVTAAVAGWRVTHLGSELPAEELAAAAAAPGALAVALSLVHPDDDPGVAEAIRRLREALPAEVRIFAGGRAVAAYREALKAAGAESFSDLGTLRARLHEIAEAPLTAARRGR